MPMHGLKGKRFPSRDSKVTVKASTRRTKHGITAVKGYDRALPSTTNSGTVTPDSMQKAIARRNRTKAITAAREAAKHKRYGYGR